jgi:gliding motility-associated-like protein
MTPRQCLRFLCCWLAGGLAGTLAAQNLVPNPDFDLFLNCPPYLGQIHEAAGWDSPNFATTDYFHSCSDSVNGNGVPANRLGWQLPLSGAGYAGIRLWIPPGIATPNQREYLVAQLLTPLQADSLYEIRFYVSLADFCTHTTDAIGLGLSATTWGTDRLQAFLPVVRQPVGKWLNDREAWTTIQGNYRAQGGEQHLIIGNFLADSALSLLNLQPNVPDPVLAAYVYIDAVSVVLIPADTTATEPIEDPCEGTQQFLETDTLLCKGAGWEVTVPPGVDAYQWGDGSLESPRTLVEPGTYALSLQTGCDTLTQLLRIQVQDCDCGWSPQNVFSPNADGINDFFELVLAPGITSARWTVHDRWGREVFRHQGPNGRWDGRYRGLPAAPGVYYWQLTYTCQEGRSPSRNQAAGNVVLLR